MDHDPPQQYGLIDTHFYSSSADRPFSPVGCGVSPILLLRTAVDMEVHGGFVKARSVTGMTCRHLLEAYWEVLILLLLLHHL